MEKQSENNNIIKIIPIGELLFRDTTSFNKKESNWIISKKIPNLSVLYGAIISMQLRKGKFGIFLLIIQLLSFLLKLVVSLKRK